MLAAFRQDEAAKSRKLAAFTLSQVVARVRYTATVLEKESPGASHSKTALVEFFKKIQCTDETDAPYSASALKFYQVLEEEMFGSPELGQEFQRLEARPQSCGLCI